jgi:hypothetical protein
LRVRSAPRTCAETRRCPTRAASRRVPAGLGTGPARDRERQWRELPRGSSRRDAAQHLKARRLHRHRADCARQWALGTCLHDPRRPAPDNPAALSLTCVRAGGAFASGPMVHSRGLQTHGAFQMHPRPTLRYLGPFARLAGHDAPVWIATNAATCVKHPFQGAFSRTTARCARARSQPTRRKPSMRSEIVAADSP